MFRSVEKTTRRNEGRKENKKEEELTDVTNLAFVPCRALTGPIGTTGDAGCTVLTWVTLASVGNGLAILAKNSRRAIARVSNSSGGIRAASSVLTRLRLARVHLWSNMMEVSEEDEEKNTEKRKKTYSSGRRFQ